MYRLLFLILLFLLGCDREKQYAKHFQTLCDEGDMQACNNLAVLYREGGYGGIQKDEAKALALFEKACTQQDARACNNLGVIYRDGTAAPKDDKRAKQLFETACALHSPLACSNAVALQTSRARAYLYQLQACVLTAPKACEALNSWIW
jgi:TPR repeat protein